ncbi:MAG: hypothetical protein VX737_01915 [Pseudomonadota bacterium]|nr:hypothetical protein [Pseudomonadota bacterium]
MFFYWFFCAFFVGVSWASHVDASYDKAHLNFHNGTSDDISIRIEKSCAPIVSMVDESSVLLKKNSDLKIEYDVSVTNCLVVASHDREFGADISLFVFDSSLNNIDFDLGFAVKSCDVYVSLREQSYHLSSDCLAIKKI